MKDYMIKYIRLLKIEVIILQLPLELKNLIEKSKAQYGIEGADDEILKKIIPSLEDEDIIRLYDELCEEENNNIISKKGYRPNFEKYREEILEYLDDTVVKAEIIRREQNQSSKQDLQQRNYTYISEFATTLDNKPDKKKIIKSFYRKIKQLEEERNLFNVQDSLHNIELILHIYQCILHVAEKMEIDLELYRGHKYGKKYKLSSQIDIRKIKRRKRSKEENTRMLQNIFLNENMKRINKLNVEKKEVKNINKEDNER